MKRILQFAFILIFTISILLTGCSGTSNDASQGTDEQAAGTQKADAPKELPEFKIGYIYTNHQTPLMLAAYKGEELKDQGIYLKEVIPKEKYILMENNEPVANIELVVNKSGSETMTMLAQGHIDLGLASNTAFITSRDQGNPVKILCPVHVEGIGLVGAADSPINSWADFVAQVKDGKEQLVVGYHSPTSAPLILFEAALREAGIDYTKDPADVNTPVLLVDLKGTNNLLPALTSKQVDAWVGPSPYPELAVTEGLGKIILDMKHLEPEGKWYDFPCCVLGTTEKVIKDYPAEVGKIVELIALATDYCELHPDEAAVVTAEFTGVSLEAAQMSTIKYTAEPSEAWINNMELTFDALKETDSLSKDLANKDFEAAKPDLFDFSFIK